MDIYIVKCGSNNKKISNNINSGYVYLQTDFLYVYVMEKFFCSQIVDVGTPNIDIPL